MFESYPAAESEIDSDATVFVQHFFGAFEGEFRLVHALPGPGQFHIQKFNHFFSIRGCAPLQSRLGREVRADRQSSNVERYQPDPAPQYRLVLAVVLDDDGVVVMTVDRTRHHNRGIWTVMPATMIVEGQRAVVAVMQALAVLVDGLDISVMMAVVGLNDQLGRLSCRNSKQKRQSARDQYLFHSEFSIL
ncbi:hypothetical protein [Mesorhizobium sp. INR15]|uniref:hypothetical protein n=1 Tax=Mesorhizobium sp. INR15 TaxID=2654248 RepID=UPI001896424C|nr:hypothetical protein [Mesorhizobium sp. INR15]